MKRTLIAILILLVATAAVAGVPARPGSKQGPAPGAPGGPGGPGAGLLPPAALAEFLDLSDAQIAQVEALRATQRATVEPLAAQQRANREQIEEALAAGNAAKAGELLLANYRLREQIKAAHETFKTSFEALLTPSQKAKWTVYEEILELRNRRPDRPE